MKTDDIVRSLWRHKANTNVNNKKGFGFITAADGKDVFVHFSGITMDGYKTLKEGQEVEFEVTKGTKGDQAVNVTPFTKKIELELEEKK